MSFPVDRVDQPSAAKPRDLRQDLAIAAEQTAKKRRLDGGEDQEKQVKHQGVHRTGRRTLHMWPSICMFRPYGCCNRLWVQRMQHDNLPSPMLGTDDTAQACQHGLLWVQSQQDDLVQHIQAEQASLSQLMHCSTWQTKAQRYRNWKPS